MNQWSDSTALPRTHPHTHNTQPKGTQTDENVQSVCYDALTYVNVQWRVVCLSLSHHLSLCHMFRFCCRGNRVSEERRMHLERWEARQRVREREGEGPTNGTGEKKKDILCIWEQLVSWWRPSLGWSCLKRASSSFPDGESKAEFRFCWTIFQSASIYILV